MNHSGMPGALWLAIVGGAVAVVACATSPHMPVAAASDPLPARCDSLPPPADTGAVDLFFTVRALQDDPVPGAYMASVIDALGHGFVPPQPLVMPAFTFDARTVGKGAREWKMTPTALGEMMFKLDALGAPSEIQLTQSTLSPALDSAFVAAVHPASTHPFPTTAAASRARRVQFVVTLTSVDSSERESIVRRGLTKYTSHSATEPVWAPLLRVRVPRWNDGRSAAHLPHGLARPQYPAAANAAGIGDTVILQFVVDETGRPMLSTIRLASDSYGEFAQSTVDALTKSTFRPASIGRCAVKEIVEQPYAFMNRRSPPDSLFASPAPPFLPPRALSPPR